MEFWKSLTGTLVLISIIVTAESLSCLHCEETDRPRHCSRITECSDGEMCNVKRERNEFGDVVFRLGCLSSCRNVSTGHCSYCCSSDLCNNQGCGDDGYPDNRGPICYSCDSRLPHHCHDIEFCDIGQVCRVIGRDVFGEQLLTSHCAYNHSCNAGQQSGILFGKRSDGFMNKALGRNTRDSHVCDKCCTEDLCNGDCAPSPINGAWENWSPWSLCSVSCGNGTETRTRSCSNPSPSHGGANCSGSVDSVRSCENTPCPVNGAWANWSSWSMCSVSCGNGTETRKRSCSNPSASHGGADCSGSGDSIRSCENTPCPVNGAWGNWTPWSVCSVSCGIGTEMRKRPCSNPSPSHGGSKCSGSKMMQRSCDNNPCPDPFDCLDILRSGRGNTTGVYTVTLWKSHRQIQVFCDQTTDGGGWTVFQRRIDGLVQFRQPFRNYQTGFGNVSGEFWLGLEDLQEMVSRTDNHNFRIDVQAANGTWGYDVYRNFSLSPGRAYTLHIGDRINSLRMSKSYRLDIGSESWAHSNNVAFSSYDMDQDNWPGGNCASGLHGAWWFDRCSNSVNLNGAYNKPGLHITGEQGFYYEAFGGRMSLKESKIMFR